MKLFILIFIIAACSSYQETSSKIVAQIRDMKLNGSWSTAESQVIIYNDGAISYDLKVEDSEDCRSGNYSLRKFVGNCGGSNTGSGYIEKFRKNLLYVDGLINVQLEMKGPYQRGHSVYLELNGIELMKRD